MSLSTLLCTKLNLRCHKTTMVPLEVVVEVIQASRSFVQTLADANKVLTLLNAFTLLIVVALLAVIGVGVVDGDVRKAYRSRLAVIGSGITDGFWCATNYVSPSFTELSAASFKAIAELRSHCVDAARWTATRISSCRSILAQRFSSLLRLTTTSDPATQKPQAVKEDEQDIQIGWSMVEK